MRSSDIENACIEAWTSVDQKRGPGRGPAWTGVDQLWTSPAHTQNQRNARWQKQTVGCTPCAYQKRGPGAWTSLDQKLGPAWTGVDQKRGPGRGPAWTGGRIHHARKSLVHARACTGFEQRMGQDAVFLSDIWGLAPTTESSISK
jgi:hypothetical protein